MAGLRGRRTLNRLHKIPAQNSPGQSRKKPLSKAKVTNRPYKNVSRDYRATEPLFSMVNATKEERTMRRRKSGPNYLSTNKGKGDHSSVAAP